jgi:hypothetical protein
MLALGDIMFAESNLQRKRVREREREREKEIERISCNILLGQKLYEEANLLSLQDMHETKQGTLFLFLR